MDKRQNVIDLLENYHPLDFTEEKDRQEILDFVKTHQDCFENDALPGHITGSALVVDKSCTHTLLTHHQKLNKWLQFGGHSDGSSDVAETAHREAVEESGLKNLKFYTNVPSVFDVDVQNIPQREEMPSHKHYDIRFLLVADKSEEVVISQESRELRWVELDKVVDLNDQQSLLRMIKKVI